MLASAMMPGLTAAVEGKNVVAILGGTNDLIRNAKGVDVASSVIALHEMAKKKMMDGGITIAITVPDMHNGCAERLIANTLIRNYATANKGSTLLYDMEDNWPLNKATAEYWSPDNLHFSLQGYERMGYEIYEILKMHFNRTNSHASHL
jgi:hypothetical protein